MTVDFSLVRDRELLVRRLRNVGEVWGVYFKYVDPAEEAAVAEILRSIRPESLEFSNSQVTTASLPLDGLQRLTWFDSQESHLHANVFPALQTLPCVNLFRIQGCALDDARLSALMSAPSLKSLWLAKCDFSAATLQNIPASPTLETLSFEECNPPQNCDKWLTMQPQLRAMKFADVALEDFDPALLAQMPALKSLELSTRIKAGWAERIPVLPQVTALTLHSQDADPALTLSLLSRLPNLEKLDLYGADCTDEFAADLQYLHSDLDVSCRVLEEEEP